MLFDNFQQGKQEFLTEYNQAREKMQQQFDYELSNWKKANIANTGSFVDPNYTWQGQMSKEPYNFEKEWAKLGSKKSD